MKTSIKYGFFLAIIFLLHSILFFYGNPRLLFNRFSNLTLWYIFLYAIFMLAVIYKNRQIHKDSGTLFKLVLITFCIASFLSYGFDFILANTYSTELNASYLEEMKGENKRMSTFFNRDPLVTLEEVELMDDSIEKDMELSDFFEYCFFHFLVLGIPLSMMVTVIGKQLIKYTPLIAK